MDAGHKAITTAGMNGWPPALIYAARAFKNTEGVGERPGLRVRRQMVRRGEVRRSSVPSIFTAPTERRLMKLEPCLADAPCRRPGPATSKCDRDVRSPLFDLRRPV